MEQYNHVKTFVEQYGDFNLKWDTYEDGVYVCVDNGMATIYKDKEAIGKIGFIYHKGSYIKHGVVLYMNGTCLCVEYYHFNKLHRENGAAETIYNKHGILSERWCEKGKTHRIGQPACKYWSEDGKPYAEEWRIDGKLHRDDGPALTQWFKNGKPRQMFWAINDNLHREDGPSCVIYYENDQIQYECYYTHGKLHREDKPTETHWAENGTVVKEIWYSHGVKFEVMETSDDWEDAEPEFD